MAPRAPRWTVLHNPWQRITKLMKSEKKDCCFECGKADSEDEKIPLYSMVMLKHGDFIIFNYCEECFQQMAGKKYVDMLGNYLQHIRLHNVEIPGVQHIGKNDNPIFVTPPSEKKFKLKNIFMHPNGIPKTWTACLFVLSFVGIYFLAMYIILGPP
jgi:hypothetical protein